MEAPEVSVQSDSDASIAAIMNQQAKSSWWSLYKSEHQLVKDIELLDFIIERVRNHVNKLQATSNMMVFLSSLCEMAVEMEGTKSCGLSYDVCCAFMEVINDKEGGPYPSLQDSCDFLTEFHIASPEDLGVQEVSGPSTDLDVSMRDGIDCWSQSPLYTRWSKFPIMQWYMNGYMLTAGGGKWTIGHGDGGPAEVYPTAAPWLYIAIYAQICAGCNNLSQSAYEFMPPGLPMRRLSFQVLPRYLLQLIELRSLLMVQTKTVSDAKAKVMGIAMTRGITLGQLLVKQFTANTGACCNE